MGSATAKGFRPPLWGTIGLVVGCTICCTAGFWQLGRAEEKQALFTAFEKSADNEILRGPVTDDDVDKYLYQRITLTGRYEPKRQILLDNMVHNGQPGYQVLTPLRIGATAVLVNRGWLPGDPDRRVLPNVAVTDKIRDVTGRLYRLPRVGYALESATSTIQTNKPVRLSFPTVAEITAQVGFPVHNYQLLLDSTEADGYTREWRPALMSPEKHLAYAIQWFMIAITIVIIYVALTVRIARRGKSDA
jgi:surfeit locus 1 family protein